MHPDLASILGLPAEDWSAIAAALTAAVALVAGAIAIFQLGEARRLRLEQAQPYVVVFAETARLGSKTLDVVIKNLGRTAAHNVRVRVKPELTRAVGHDDAYRIVEYPKEFPVLVPGQSWRTLWDSAVRRHQSTLPSQHVAEVSFKDSAGTAYNLSYVLDWEASVGRMYVETLGEHDAAKALREISRTLSRWSDGRGGLAVNARDGDAMDQRHRAEYEDAAKDPFVGPVLESPESGDAAPDDS